MLSFQDYHNLNKISSNCCIAFTLRNCHTHNTCKCTCICNVVMMNQFYQQTPHASLKYLHSQHLVIKTVSVPVLHQMTVHIQDSPSLTRHKLSHNIWSLCLLGSHQTYLQRPRIKQIEIIVYH